VARLAFPNQPSTIVPLALTLATLMKSSEEAILLATNVGGDSDSVASIAGGILGAMYPSTISDDWYEIVERVNQHDLTPIAHKLAQIRESHDR
jgi:ADP-ribosylglycohydrolase